VFWFAMTLILPAAAVIVLLLLIARAARIGALERELRTLRERVERLETRGATPGSTPLATPVVAPPALPSIPPPARPHRALDPGRLENQIGSVWFQNLGAVMILVGTFFLILWGYTTGRFGPGVLVGAVAGVGLAIAWRGDRLVRVLPRFGQALVGLGFGVVYVTLFLGHFTLRVLPAFPAFALLVATSLATLLAGLRHRVQTIGALGVLGAFLPQILARTLPLPGFALSAGGLLAYLAAVDVVVFALAARAGWSGLDLASLLLTVLTWRVSFPGAPGGWPVTIGLSVLFIALGLAPVPRLLRVEGVVRPIDLGAIAVAPLALLVCAWPALELANARVVGTYFTACAALYLATALWVDVRRPERDLWRPLTGVATLFVTIALQRFAGPVNTPIAWAAEAALLVTLGIAPRSGWLRLCGHVVALMSGVWLLTILFRPPGNAGLFELAAVRDLITVLLLMAGAWRLYTGRARLAASESLIAPLWLAGASVLLMAWSWEEAAIAGWVFAGPRSSPNLEAPPPIVRREQLMAAVMALAWLVQAAVTALAGIRARPGSVRRIGYAVGCFALMATLFTLAAPDGWGRDERPLLYAPALALLLVVAGAVLVAVQLALAREAGRPVERWAPHVWAGGIALLLMAWIGREADHVARLASGVPGPNARALAKAGTGALAHAHPLARVLVSAGWLIEAILALLIGWFARSRFVRWMGLVLAALTALKFVFADLASADPFWRFLTAIAVGVVLLVVSFAYQRRQRGAQAGV
jgi:hypothetical protein